MSEAGSRSRRNRRTESASALQYRRELRANLTKAEQLVWSLLRDRRLDGHKFRRQMSIESFIVDFACPECHLVIELDGRSQEFSVE